MIRLYIIEKFEVKSVDISAIFYFTQVPMEHFKTTVTKVTFFFWLFLQPFQKLL